MLGWKVFHFLNGHNINSQIQRIWLHFLRCTSTLRMYYLHRTEGSLWQRILITTTCFSCSTLTICFLSKLPEWANCCFRCKCSQRRKFAPSWIVLQSYFQLVPNNLRQILRTNKNKCSTQLWNDNLIGRRYKRYPNGNNNMKCIFQKYGSWACLPDETH